MKRTYKLRDRARRRDETRQRITEAAVELHGTVGPARTTIQEIARLAGVQRMTVYNHFATDGDLFDACSGHWFAQNPPPDPTSWSRIEDPLERTGTALWELYGYYDRNQRMLGNVLRDAPLIPALGSIMGQKWSPFVEQIVTVLCGGVRTGAPPDTFRRATLRMFLDFSTWRSLADSGLSIEQAAQLGARLVAASADGE